MRLGQLAKKHDVPVKEIIAFLEEQTGEKFHPNAKLYDTLEAKVFEQFNLQPQAAPEPIHDTSTTESNSAAVESVDSEIEEQVFPATPEEEIALLEGDLILPDKEGQENQQKKEVNIEQVESGEPSADEIIQSDQLLELLESEESIKELDKIKLIKAPKKELSGLKVLGKVDLPEPKKKEEKPSDIVTEKDLREYRNPRKKRQPLSPDEKEKRRLKAKRKKEAYEARLEKQRKEREEQERKARKEQHYKKKLEQAKAIQVKHKMRQETSASPSISEKTHPEPKTMLGKFWRWMNT